MLKLWTYKMFRSYLYYYIGHILSIPMYKWDCFSWLYPAYNWLMIKSYDIQEETGCKGPWINK